LARRSSPGTHKRLMIIATVVLLDAAFARIRWLPGMPPTNSGFELMSAYQLLLLAPLVVFDLRRTGQIHRASLFGVGLLAVSAIIVNTLWGADWWIQAAPRLLRIGHE